MSTRTQAQHSGGVGFFGLLTILFIGLKLGEVIDWSWWWVLSPLWLPIAVLLGAWVLFLVVGLALNLLQHRAAKKRFQKRWGSGR